jgi:hypothetical protein
MKFKPGDLVEHYTGEHGLIVAYAHRHFRVLWLQDACAAGRTYLYNREFFLKNFVKYS